jgi:enamine deaminase RidA (YjgF/YER057c/UK114 family)
MVILFLFPVALGIISFPSICYISRLMIRLRYDYSTGEISPDVVEQTEQVMLNIDAALREAGSGMKDVVRVRYVFPDRNDFPKCWPVLRKWFGDVRPAAIMIQAGLLEEIMKVEIEVTAKKSTG